MEWIIKGRGEGKTTRLIKISYETDQYIVCHNRKEAIRIVDLADSMGLHILFPITYADFVSSRYSTQINGLLIDNVDRLLNYISSVPITTATLSQPTLNEGE